MDVKPLDREQARQLSSMWFYDGMDGEDQCTYRAIFNIANGAHAVHDTRTYRAVSVETLRTMQLNGRGVGVSVEAWKNALREIDELLKP